MKLWISCCKLHFYSNGPVLLWHLADTVTQQLAPGCYSLAFSQVKTPYVFARWCLKLHVVRGCSGPREDATRIGSAGVIRRQAVDISPLRRVNSAIYLISTGAREASFRNIKTIAECLADELINAAKGSSNR